MFRSFITLSPDGRYVTYVTARGIVPDGISLDDAVLWLVNVDTGQTNDLARFPDNLWPTAFLWSPDSTRLAFVQTCSEPSAARIGALELWWMDVRTAQAALLIRDLSFNADIFYRVPPPAIQWSPAGDAISYILYHLAGGEKTVNTFYLKGDKHESQVQSLSVAEKQTLKTLASLPCPVPLFSQRDPRWKDDMMQTCGQTIGAAGCALTSTAMEFKYYGKSTDPRQLNQCLGNAACPIYWGTAASNCSSGRASYDGAPGFSWSRMEQALQQGYPPILRVCKYGDCDNSPHFVVVVSGYGSSASNYTINDPWDGANKNLTAYTNDNWYVESLRIFHGTPSCCCCTYALSANTQGTVPSPSLAPATPTTAVAPASPPDTTPPAMFASATASTDTANNQWQAATRQPRFTWEPATDAGSGVAGYTVYWGPDPTGAAANFSATPDYAPAEPTCAADESVTWYLRVQPVDNARNHGPWQTLFTVKYDGQAPTGALAINDGQPEASTPNVALQLTAHDVGSGVAEMRLRNVGAEWSEWGPYRDRVSWRLPNGEGRRTVEAQFQDEAGNESPLCTASIDVQFVTMPPSSANYRLVRSETAIGGGRKTSASYALNATAGQAAAAGSTRSSASYRLRSGFWGPSSASAPNYKLYLPLVLKR